MKKLRIWFYKLIGVYHREENLIKAAQHNLDLAKSIARDFSNRPEKFTVLKVFEPDNLEYLAGIARVWDSEEFRFFLLTFREQKIEDMKHGPLVARDVALGGLVTVDAMKKTLSELRAEFVRRMADQREGAGNEEI